MWEVLGDLLFPPTDLKHRDAKKSEQDVLRVSRAQSESRASLSVPSIMEARRLHCFAAPQLLVIKAL